MNNGRILIKRCRKITVLVLLLTMMITTVCNNSLNDSIAAKRMKLQIKTTRYRIKKPLNKPQKSQKILIKNLSRKYKVTWKSSNKKLASVKKLRSSKNKAKITVFLNNVKPLPVKKQTVQIKAIIKTKKSNKKVKTFTKRITFVNVPVNSSKPTSYPSTPLPTLLPPVSTPAPTNTGDNYVTLPPNDPSPTPGEVFITAPPDDESPTPTTAITESPSPTPASVTASPPAVTPTRSPTATPTKNPKDDGWTDWY